MSKYEEIRGQLQTGDIVLFSGRGRASQGIKWLTLCPWSHVGMVLRMPPGAGPLADTVLLWESTNFDNLKDVLEGVARRGVQLVLLSERVQVYPGEIAVRPLSVQRDEAMFEALSALRMKLRNRPFEEKKLELLRAALDGPFERWRSSEDLSSLFCSELIAETYQALGLLPDHPDAKPSNEYTPRDFAGDLALLRGAVLGPVLPIK
jgi:hypothetical protein